MSDACCTYELRSVQSRSGRRDAAVAIAIKFVERRRRPFELFLGDGCGLGVEAAAPSHIPRYSAIPLAPNQPFEPSAL